MVPGVVPRALRALRVRVLRRFRWLAAALALTSFLSFQLRFEKLVAPPRFLQSRVQPLDEVDQVAQQFFDIFAGSLDPGDNLLNGGFELVSARLRWSSWWDSPLAPANTIGHNAILWQPEISLNPQKATASSSVPVSAENTENHPRPGFMRGYGSQQEIPKIPSHSSIFRPFLP